MKNIIKLLLSGMILAMIIGVVPVLAETELSEFEYKNDGTIFTSINLKNETKASVDFEQEISLLSTTESINNVDYSFQVNNNILSGDFSADIIVDSEISADVILAVYDSNKLEYISKSVFNLISGSTPVSFENIEAKVNSDKFAVKLFVWESECCKPICKDYVFAVDYSPLVYTDGFEAEDALPVYIYGEEIYAPISILQDLGVEVQVDTETGVIYTMKNNCYMNMQIGNKSVYAMRGSNSSDYKSVKAPAVMNGTIYIPVSTACKAYKFDIEYNLASGEFWFYTNEIMEARSREIDYNSFGIMLMNDECSAVISNGLFYYVAMDRPCIYITNGNATVSYPTSGIPSGLIVAGDKIYYKAENTLHELDKFTGADRAIVSRIKGDFSYYNGKIYTKNFVYHLSTGKKVDFEEYHFVDSGEECSEGIDKFIILNDKCIYGVSDYYLDRSSSFMSVGVDVREINTDTGEMKILDKYIIDYYQYNRWHSTENIAFYNGQIYICLDNDRLNEEEYLRATFNDDGTNIEETTKNAYNNAVAYGRSDIDNFAATLTTSDYLFRNSSNGIIRRNRKTGGEVCIISGRTNNINRDFVTASDEYVVYTEYTHNGYNYNELILQVADTSGNNLGSLGVYTNGMYTPI